MGRQRNEKILIIDGFTLERQSVKALLLASAGVSMVQEVANTEGAKRHLERSTFDLIIYNLLSSEKAELNALREVNQLVGDQPVLVVGPDIDTEDTVRNLQGSIHGYTTKQKGKEGLLQAVQDLLDGKTYFVTLGSKQAQRTAATAKAKKEGISNREKEILKLVINGMNNHTIGKELNISVRTVENHRANMMRKLGVKNTAELVKKAITEKLIDLQ